MKKLHLIFLLLLVISSCKKQPNAYEQLSDDKTLAVLTLQKGINGRQTLSIFPQEGRKTTSLSVNYGGIGYPASTIDIKLEVDEQAMDSINNLRTLNGETPYARFPDGSFSLDRNTISIEAGSYTSDFATLTYDTDQFELDQQYLLVFKASNNTGYQFSQGINKVEFLAAVIEKEHEKIGWSASASSEELVGEGTSNGRAARLIDNNVNTFWHSKWQGGEPPYPHDFTINFGTDLYLTRVAMTRRQNNNNGFYQFDLLGSTDGSSFTLIRADLDMNRDELAAQSFSLPSPGYFKAIKVVMKTGFSTAASTHCAEFSAFGY